MMYQASGNISGILELADVTGTFFFHYYLFIFCFIIIYFNLFLLFFFNV